MKIVQQDGLNFLLTNALPRRHLTRLVGWFSKVENPLVCAASVGVWRMFTDLDLSDAQQARFASMHQCFTRRLKPGARPVDPDPAVLASPCDAIIGACGTVRAGEVLQIKGMPYSLLDLFGDEAHAASVEGGQYVTLRLTSAMYHRFHAPYDCRVSAVTHIFGDVWNVNPVTLRRVARLFCKNERALIRTTMAGHDVTLVTVAAVLVAGIRLGFLDLPLKDRELPRRSYACDATLQKGEEMGWFEHGSTILVFVPAGFTLCEDLGEGRMIRAGERLMQLPM
jgi:phosphatidylserine decarboxylase